MLWLVLVSVLLTATLSGVFGMAGGMILMAVYLSILGTREAMVLHGVTQLASNGFRAFLLRRHCLLSVVWLYLVGAAVSVGLFACVQLSLDRGWAFLVLGILPWLGLLGHRVRLRASRPGHALLCGMVVTAAHLTAGVSGPILDVFFLDSSLTRHQIIATKAVTQSCAHLLKIVYFGLWMVGDGGLDFPVWWCLAVIPLAFAGTWVGRQILEKLSDRSFLHGSRMIVLSLGAVCATRGLYLIFR